MALTKEQWYAKLKNFVPRWFFQTEINQKAHLLALAKILNEAQAESELHRDRTFITLASDEFLDAHGSERDVERLTGELDSQYSLRVRSLRNQSNKVSIKAIVDALLVAGESIIREDEGNGFGSYCSRENFCNRADLILEGTYNAFSVIVDKQLHAPYSFCDREDFCDRVDFVGEAESSLQLFELIVAAVNKAKAHGVLYRVIERLES